MIVTPELSVALLALEAALVKSGANTAGMELRLPREEKLTLGALDYAGGMLFPDSGVRVLVGEEARRPAYLELAPPLSTRLKEVLPPEETWGPIERDTGEYVVQLVFNSEPTQEDRRRIHERLR